VDSPAVEYPDLAMVNVVVALPEDLVSQLPGPPGDLASEVRAAAVLDWVRRGLLSQGRAAEVLGLTRAEMLDELARRGIENVAVDPDELRREAGVG
jgi:predicted HTH domain antitoxin